VGSLHVRRSGAPDIVLSTKNAAAEKELEKRRF
jgi:hypothetical protein